MTAGQSLRLFPTPVIIGQVDDAEALNRELVALIIAKMAADRGIRRSNVGGWHSDIDLLQWTGAAGERIAATAKALASAHTEVTGFDAEALDWGVEAWANVSGSGHSNMAHVHGGAFWSLVYYVQLGAGRGGRLMLDDPRMPALQMHAPGVGFKDAGPQIIAPIDPVPGQLVMFPAWLSHSVEPWTGKGERISIALNLSVRRTREDLPKPGVRKVSVRVPTLLKAGDPARSPSDQ